MPFHLHGVVVFTPESRGPSPEGSPAPGTRCAQAHRRTGCTTHRPGRAPPHWPLQIHVQVQGSADNPVFFSSNTQHLDLCGWPGARPGSGWEELTSTRLPLRNLGRGQVPKPNILPCNPAQSSSAHRHTHTNAHSRKLACSGPPVPWIRSRSFTHRVCGP